MSINIECGTNVVWSYLSGLGMKICLSLTVISCLADFLRWSFSFFEKVSGLLVLLSQCLSVKLC